MKKSIYCLFLLLVIQQVLFAQSKNPIVLIGEVKVIRAISDLYSPEIEIDIKIANIIHGKVDGLGCDSLIRINNFPFLEDKDSIVFYRNGILGSIKLNEQYLFFLKDSVVGIAERLQGDIDDLKHDCYYPKYLLFDSTYNYSKELVNSKNNSYKKSGQGNGEVGISLKSKILPDSWLELKFDAQKIKDRFQVVAINEKNGKKILYDSGEIHGKSERVKVFLSDLEVVDKFVIKITSDSPKSQWNIAYRIYSIWLDGNGSK